MSMDFFDIEDSDDYNEDLVKKIMETQLFNTTDNMLFNLNTTSFFLFAIGHSQYWFDSGSDILNPEPIELETIFESVSDDLKCKLIFNLDLFFKNNFKTSEEEGFWVRK